MQANFCKIGDIEKGTEMALCVFQITHCILNENGAQSGCQLSFERRTFGDSGEYFLSQFGLCRGLFGHSMVFCSFKRLFKIGNQTSMSKVNLAA